MTNSGCLMMIGFTIISLVVGNIHGALNGWLVFGGGLIFIGMCELMSSRKD